MALAISWGLERPPLRDAVTWEPAQDVSLVVPAAYAACSPLCRTLDALATMSSGQLAALAITSCIVFATWRLVRRRRRLTTRLREVLAAGAAVGILGLLVLLGAAAPRPMLSLTTLRLDELRVDFHSHTSSSHDGRPGFGADARRKWHRRAGFDVAYVSDHRVFDAAEAALSGNPATSGGGTVLLPAYEGRYLGSFVIMLGLRRGDSALIDGKRHLREGVSVAGRRPISVAVLPGLLGRDVNAHSRDSLPRIRAVQLWDGSPTASWQGQRERDTLLALASALGLPVVAGTNHHGWGHSPAAWNLITLPGWRDLPPDSLGASLEAMLGAGETNRIRVVERRRPDPRGSFPALAATAPAAAVHMLVTLTPLERLSWLCWGLALGVLAGRRPNRVS